MNSNKLTDIKNNIKSEVKEKLGSIKGKSPPDNKRLIKIILIAVIVITILVTLTYFVGWLAEKLYDFMNVEYEARSDFFHCIGTALSGKVVPIFLWVTFAAVIIILGIFLWNIRRERSQPDGEQDDRNFTYSESGDFGTNRALRGYETTSVFNFQKELGESSEFIVGEDIDTGEIVTMKPIEESYRNPNIAIIGSPGTMKTRTVINNYMLQSIRQGRSVFCIDTKGSLYSDFYNLADSRGYTQRVLNLCEIDKSDGFDPLDIVKDIVVSSISWTTYKAREVTRAQYNTFKDFIDAIPVSNITCKIAVACRCSDPAAKELLDEFLNMVWKYVDGNSLEDKIILSAISANTKLQEKAKELIRQDWEKGNEKLLTEAQQKLDLLHTELKSAAADLGKAQEAFNKTKAEDDRLSSIIAEKEKLADGIEKAVAERIQKARENAADFIASMAFVGGQPMQVVGSAASPSPSTAWPLP